MNTLQAPAAITPPATQSQPLTAQTCRDLIPASVQLYSGDQFGSGTIVSPDGAIVTALHVVKAGSVRVKRGNDLMTGVVTAQSAQHDLALVQIKTAKPLPFVQLGATPARGATVCGIGNQRNTVTVLAGTVKGVGAQIVTNLPSRPGDSGGMVVADGKLVGVTSAIWLDAAGKPTDEAFATRTEWVRELMRRKP